MAAPNQKVATDLFDVNKTRFVVSHDPPQLLLEEYSTGVEQRETPAIDRAGQGSGNSCTFLNIPSLCALANPR